MAAQLITDALVPWTTTAPRVSGAKLEEEPVERDAIDPKFAAFMQECGYGGVRAIGGGRYACLGRFLLTCAIIVGRIGDRAGYDDRWCYEDEAAAAAALAAWDGTGEPAGWHRHPGTGRRRPEADPASEHVAW